MLVEMRMLNIASPSAFKKNQLAGSTFAAVLCSLLSVCVIWSACWLPRKQRYLLLMLFRWRPTSKEGQIDKDVSFSQLCLMGRRFRVQCVIFGLIYDFYIGRNVHILPINTLKCV